MSNNINVLKDIIYIRDNIKEYASLGMNDANDIIDEMCLNYNYLKCPFVENKDITILSTLQKYIYGAR